MMLNKHLEAEILNAKCNNMPLEEILKEMEGSLEDTYESESLIDHGLINAIASLRKILKK